MYNIINSWTRDLYEITLSTYTLNYDYRIHAVQSALIMLFQNEYDLKKELGSTFIKYESIQFGFHASETDRLCKVFQRKYITQSAYTEEFFKRVFNQLFSIMGVAYYYSPQDQRIFIAKVIDRNADGKITMDDLTYDDFSVFSIINSQEDLVESDPLDSFSYESYGDGYYNMLNLLNYEYPRNINHFEIDYDTIKVSETYRNTFSNSSNVEFDSLFSQGELQVANNSYIGNNSYSFYKGNVMESKSRLANEIYTSENIFQDFEEFWVSTSIPTINNYEFGYEASDKYSNFFKSGAYATHRRTKFDITIVYGQENTKSIKILEVTPRSVTQEVSPNGDAIYNVVEFVAKDLVENN